MKSVPHRCEPCVEEASYFGQLVFGSAKPPVCKTHQRPITPVFPRAEKVTADDTSSSAVTRYRPADPAGSVGHKPTTPKGASITRREPPARKITPEVIRHLRESGASRDLVEFAERHARR